MTDQLPRRWDGTQADGVTMGVEWFYGDEEPLTVWVADDVVIRCSKTMALGLVNALTTFLFYEETGPPDVTRRLGGVR